MQKALMLVFGWLMKSAQLNFVLTAVIGLLFTFAVNFMIPLLGSFISPSGLSAAFGSIDGHVWYFINLMNLVDGTSIIISAFVARFLIRRLPFIG